MSRFGDSVNGRVSMGQSTPTPYSNLEDDGKVEVQNPGAPPAGGGEHDVELTQSTAALFGQGPVDEEGLTEAQVQERRQQFGWNELPEKKINKWWELAKAFWGPMPALIWVAIIVELAVAIWKDTLGRKGAIGPDKDYVDFVVLMILQIFNAVVGWHEEMKAGDAVAELKKSLAPVAFVKRRNGSGHGEEIKVNGRDLVPGDIITLALGAAVPADARVLAGKGISVDQAALTGESLPVRMVEGDVAKMGSTVSNGEVEAVVVATGARTFFGKTAALLNSVEERSNLEKVLLHILGAICAVGCPCIIIVIVVMAVRGIQAYVVITTAVVLLVAIVPIANQVVCTTTLALGSRILSAEGAIVTRLTSIESLAGMNMLCSDKTGTLTKNIMEMQSIIGPTGESEFSVITDSTSNKNGYLVEEGLSATHRQQARAVLKNAALAAKWKEAGKDALDRLVLGSDTVTAMRAELDTYEQLDYEPFDPTIKRTAATLRSPQGKTFKATKGAPPVVLKMCWNYEAIKEKLESWIDNLGERGIRALAVAVTDDKGRWCFNGIICFFDPPRHDTKQTIEDANELGVRVKMITGDQLKIAKETCRILGMGTNVYGTADLPGADEPVSGEGPLAEQIEAADGFAGVYPEHKFNIVEILRKRDCVTGMTGDGVNDAPALKVADVGIAVEGATDAARAAADIVLTDPGLSTIVTAIVLAREIFQRMKNYLIYRIASSLMLGLFFMLSVSACKPLSYTGCDVLDSSSAAQGYKHCFIRNCAGMGANCSTTAPPHCGQKELTASYCIPPQQCLPGGAKGGYSNCIKATDPGYQAACPSQAILQGMPSGHTSATSHVVLKPYDSDYHTGQLCYTYSPSDAPAGSGNSQFVYDRDGVPMNDYFVLTILQLVLMIVFNDGCMITVAYDNVRKSARPKSWALSELYILSGALAITVTTAQYIYLWLGMGALRYGDNELNAFRAIFGIDDPLSASQLHGMMYISLSWAGFLTLLSGRTEGPFYEQRMGNLLLIAFFISVFASLMFGGFLTSLKIDFIACPWPYIGVTFLYNVLMFIVLDLVKVGTNKWLMWYFHGDEVLKSQQDEARRQNMSRIQVERASKLQLSRLNPSDISNAGDWQVNRELSEVVRAPDKARELNQSIHSTYDEKAKGKMTGAANLRKRVSKLTDLGARLATVSKDPQALRLLGELREITPVEE
jgi:H+-transporting ATPase